MQCPQWITPPVRGRWTTAGFPDVVVVVGRRFRRALIAMPRAGVVAHYREERARFSAHLVVTVAGEWVIDHLDCINPTFGPFHAAAHIAHDVVRDALPDISRASWWTEMRAAALENVRDPIVAASFDSVPRAGLSTAIAARLPYRFGPDQPVASSWRRCLSRGFAACADAVSLVAAIAARRGATDAVSICLETDEGVPDYAHVRVIWKGAPTIAVDPWPERSLAVNRCTTLTPARRLIPPSLLRSTARAL